RISSKWSKILRKESFIRDGWLDKRNIAGQENYPGFSGVRIPPDTARQEDLLLLS
ncbi:2450_t:CDS:1, partial [Funneliformis geosporum]